MKKFSGTGVALVTPFQKDGGIDEPSLKNLVEHVIEGGVDYLVALGTTSEAATLEEPERYRVMEIILEQNRKRVPVMVGIGGNNTREVIKNIRKFPYASCCDAVLSVTPYYNKPSQEGLYAHFKEISEESELPVVLYNVPGRTSVNMAASTTVRLSLDCPRILGIKEAGGNVQQVTEILKGKREDFRVLSGDDGLALPLLSIGAEGVISVLANFLPGEFSRMMRLGMEGDFRAAALLHRKFADWYRVLFAEGNPAGVKAALQIARIIESNTLRLPLLPVSEALHKEMLRLYHSM